MVGVSIQHLLVFEQQANYDTAYLYFWMIMMLALIRHMLLVWSNYSHYSADACYEKM